MTYQTHTLNNGLRIIHQPSESNISYCGFAINVGTRNEQSGEEGMAHFVEHMLFKGTRKRKTHHIVNRMENVGGELNAYTTKEETFVYATFLEEYTQRAMELLGDMLFNSDFPQNQIDRERDVILVNAMSYLMRFNLIRILLLNLSLMTLRGYFSLIILSETIFWVRKNL